MACAYPPPAAMFRSCAEAVESAGARATSDEIIDRWNACTEVLRGPVFGTIVDRRFASFDGVARQRVSATDARN